MGRKKRFYQDIELPEGVRVRGRNLQVMFYWHGKQQFVTLKGLDPTERNIAYAGGLVTTIKREIDLTLFSWSKHFPEHKHARSELSLSHDTTVGTILQDYMDDGLKSRSGVTQDNYLYRINRYLMPEFGHIPLKDFRAGHVRRWAKTMSCSNSTISSYIAPLRSAFREAVRDEKITANPLDNLILPDETPEQKEKKRKRREEVSPFNPDERKAILKACENRPEEYNAILFCFWTGLRLEELFALQWQDLDFVHNTVRIQRALVKRKGYKLNGDKSVSFIEIKGLKTEGKGFSERDIDILPPALKAIKAQRPLSQMKSEFVFPSPGTCRPWQGTGVFYNRWKAILKLAGVRYRSPYNMRHTYASTLLESGEDESYVANMLGHTSTETVRKTYRRQIRNAQKKTGYHIRNNWENAI